MVPHDSSLMPRKALLGSSIPSIIPISGVLFFVIINNLLNSAVRVLLSYGRSHWFKSNSRYNLLDTIYSGI